MKQPAEAPRRIAIDGPAASGKSAVGTALARRLGFVFVDTGAIYRALTWLVLEKRLNPARTDAVAALAATADISLGQDAAGQSTVIIDGRDATPFLREPRVDSAVSAVSAIPEVRRDLIDVQRRLAEGWVVMAGRDIGSVVLPDAELKIFLDASPEERAKRRLNELRSAGDPRALNDLIAELGERDRLDSTRASAPLVVPADAVRLQTDTLPLGTVIKTVLDLALRQWPDLDRGPAARPNPR